MWKGLLYPVPAHHYPSPMSSFISYYFPKLQFPSVYYGLAAPFQHTMELAHAVPSTVKASSPFPSYHHAPLFFKLHIKNFYASFYLQV